MKWKWFLIIVLIVSLFLFTPWVITSVQETIRLASLEFNTRMAVNRLRQVLAEDGIRTFVGQTRRTDAEQAAIDPARTGTDNSWHELGRAIDLYVYDPDTGKPDLNGKRKDLYLKMHQRAKTLGFTGLAFNTDWSIRYITTKAGTKTWDGGHLEFRQGMSWKDAAELVA